MYYTHTICLFCASHIFYGYTRNNIIYVMRVNLGNVLDEGLRITLFDTRKTSMEGGYLGKE
jgi:hypothetical protein